MELHKIFILILGIVHSSVGQEVWSNVISRVPVGVPGVDYPNYISVPRRTSFTCRDRKPGFYADPDTRCQAWHWCDTFLIKHSFLCPNMTVFSQKIRGCDWWYNVNCDLAVSLYGNNDELYGSDLEDEDRQTRKEVRDEVQPNPGPNRGFDIPRVGSSPTDSGLSARQPEPVDYDGPTIEIQTPSSTLPITRTASPVTGGILRRRPFTRVPPPSNSFHSNVNNNANPIAFPLPNVNTASTTDHGFPLTAPSNGQGTTFDFSELPGTKNVPDIGHDPQHPQFITSTSASISHPSNTSPVATAHFDFTSLPENQSGATSPAHHNFSPSVDTLLTTAGDGTSGLSTSSGHAIHEEDQPKPSAPVATSDFEDIFSKTRLSLSPHSTAITTAQAPPSTFYTFTPFTARPTTDRNIPFVFRGSSTTTVRPSFPESGLPSRTSKEPFTRPFDFGVPFGARIGGGSRRVDNSVSTQSIGDASGNGLHSSSLDVTSQVSNDVTVPTLRRRKFVASSRQTFPPFPFSTFAPKSTPSEATTEEFSSIAPPNDASTTKRRTFPSFPITTFKPPTSTPARRITIDESFGEKDLSSPSVINDNVLIGQPNATSFSLGDDLSLAR